MKKITIMFSILAFTAASFVPSVLMAGCYDVTYPTEYCDPQGEGSCTRICCETQNCDT